MRNFGWLLLSLSKDGVMEAQIVGGPKPAPGSAVAAATFAATALSPATRIVEIQVRSSQGNRVKKLCGDKACEEVVIPGGDFAAESEGILSPGSPD